MQSTLTLRTLRRPIVAGAAELASTRTLSSGPLMPTSSETVCFNVWEPRFPELKQLAEPLLISHAVTRLSSITFLGLLSPSFASLPQSPIHKLKSGLSLSNDGSRYSHSLGVAGLLLDLARDLHLSIETQRYAIAWGLLHDVATWALSHTGEVAFATATKTTSGRLREMILLGDKKLPATLTLLNQLKEIGVDPLQLVDLFSLNRIPANPELRILLEIIKSPITPDSLEGIWRTGTAIGLLVPLPKDVQRVIQRDFFGLRINKEHYQTAIRFWRIKAELYRKYINHSRTIRWESTWSAAILARYRNIGLVESINLSESEILSRVDPSHMLKHINITRYKAPLEYYVDCNTKYSINAELPFSVLNSLLRKKAKHVDTKLLPE